MADPQTYRWLSPWLKTLVFEEMTRHNYLQKRSRLLKSIRDASTAYLWYCNMTYPQARKATTLAAKKMMEGARDLWKLGTMPK